MIIVCEGWQKWRSIIRKKIEKKKSDEAGKEEREKEGREERRENDVRIFLLSLKGGRDKRVPKERREIRLALR